MSKMYGKRAYELVKSLAVCNEAEIPPFDENTMRLILAEMNTLYQLNQRDTSLSTIEGNNSVIPPIHLRHAALQRNQQCVLAYLYNRIIKLRNMRWTHGAIIPSDARLNSTEQELQFFRNYTQVLANYMRDIGDSSEDDNNYIGLDLTQDREPPKGLTVLIRALKTWEVQLESGELIELREGDVQLLPQMYVEHLVREGVVEYAKPGVAK